MRIVTKSVSDLISSKESPLPLEVIPNNMGINLCSVEALTWVKQNDGQLVSLTIHFIPVEKTLQDEYLEQQKQLKEKDARLDKYLKDNGITEEQYAMDSERINKIVSEL
jgi:hypothetical protein